MRVGLLLGGRSNEREGSLLSGDTVRASLERIGHQVVLIDPAEENAWSKLPGCDCAFIALHGTHGEDGRAQGLLESMGIPYTGPGVLASALGMHKPTFKRLLLSASLPTPAFVAQPGGLRGDCTKELTTRLKLPLVLKPESEGGSLGIRVCHSESQLIEAVADVAHDSRAFFAEAFVRGRFITLGIGGRLDQPFTYVPVYVEHPGDVYDYDIKHSDGIAQYHVPAPLSPSILAAIERDSLATYRLLGCHGPIRLDMMIDAADNHYILEINSVPGLSLRSNLFASARGSGLTYDALIKTFLESALSRPARYAP